MFYKSFSNKKKHKSLNQSWEVVLRIQWKRQNVENIRTKYVNMDMLTLLYFQPKNMVYYYKQIFFRNVNNVKICWANEHFGQATFWARDTKMKLWKKNVSMCTLIDMCRVRRIMLFLNLNRTERREVNELIFVYSSRVQADALGKLQILVERDEK